MASDLPPAADAARGGRANSLNRVVPSLASDLPSAAQAAKGGRANSLIGTITRSTVAAVVTIVAMGRWNKNLPQVGPNRSASVLPLVAIASKGERANSRGARAAMISPTFPTSNFIAAAMVRTTHPAFDIMCRANSLRGAVNERFTNAFRIHHTKSINNCGFTRVATAMDKHRATNKQVKWGTTSMLARAPAGAYVCAA